MLELGSRPCEMAIQAHRHIAAAQLASSLHEEASISRALELALAMKFVIYSI